MNPCNILLAMRVDDETLAARAKDGDERTFEELALRYSDRLYAFCRARLGSENDAKDSAQDALVRAYRSLPSYDSSKPWSAWVFSIAANRVKSRYAAASSAERLALRVSAEQAVADEASADRSGPEAEALRILAAEELRSAVAGLSASLRSPVELYYFAGLDVATVAAALGLGAEAVKSRLLRARRRLGRILGDTAQPDGCKKGM